MAFELGAKSRAKMEGIHAHLHRVTMHAISISEVDFCITEGLRARERQAALVAAGASRTMDGRHLTGHAVDVAAVVEGVISWKWPLYPIIAKAFRKAAIDEGVPIVWGAVWDRLLGNILDPDPGDAVTEYERRWRALNPVAAAKGRGPLIDGPHFELSRAVYPVLHGATTT